MLAFNGERTALAHGFEVGEDMLMCVFGVPLCCVNKYVHKSIVGKDL